MWLAQSWGRSPAIKEHCPRQAAVQGTGAVLRVQPGTTRLLLAPRRGWSRQHVDPGFRLSAGEDAKVKQQTPRNILLSESEI